LAKNGPQHPVIWSETAGGISEGEVKWAVGDLMSRSHDTSGSPQLDENMQFPSRTLCQERGKYYD